MGQTFFDDDWCFCCGRKNERGLKLDFWFEGEEYVTKFVPGKEFQGFADIVHGGILALLLDEVMARSLWVRGRRYVTAELTVRLHRPAPVGQELTFRARVVRDRPRVVHMEARCLGPEGTVLASASGKLLPVP